MTDEVGPGWSRAELLRHADALTVFLRRTLPAAPTTALPPGAQIARAAAVLAPLYVRDGVPCLLFTLRSQDLSKHRGEISFPGGSRDATDSSLEQTALRETREELGLDPAAVDLLGPLPTVFAQVSNFLIQPYVGWLGGGLPMLTPNPREVAEVIEAPLEALAKPAIYHSEIWRRAGEAHLIHFYDFGPYRIWGVTAHILRSLLDMLPAG